MRERALAHKTYMERPLPQLTKSSTNKDFCVRRYIKKITKKKWKKNTKKKKAQKNGKRREEMRKTGILTWGSARKKD